MCCVWSAIEEKFENGHYANEDVTQSGNENGTDEENHQTNKEFQ